MITYWTYRNHGKLVKLDTFEPGCWINVIAPTKTEIHNITTDFVFDRDWIGDILDIDEQSRVEKDDNQTLIILRVPVYNEAHEVPYFTIPMGVLMLETCMMTISLYDNIVVQNMCSNKMRSYTISSDMSFLFMLFFRSASNFLNYLKSINRQSSEIEHDLLKSIKNHELFKLLTLEKSLVFFTTSLKSNELVLEKLERGHLLKFEEEDGYILEDAITENQQAISMAKVYSDILSGMMDAFASVISNNLNHVMKRLTAISLLIMLPTMITSAYGMNIGLPFQHSSWAWVGIFVTSIAVPLLSLLIFRKKDFF